MTRLPSVGPGAPALVADVGGTTIKVARIDETGALSEPVRVPTPRDGARTPERILERIAAEGDGSERILGIGVPGIVDDVRGVGVFSENLGWRDADFRALGREVAGLDTAVLHDVRAAGLAEQRLGAAAGLDDVVVITLGTGISAAVVIGGSLHVAGGYAGEIGHAVVVDGGEPCVCGNTGCLEAVASAAAIARRYETRTGHEVAGAHEVLALADAGDAAAQRVWSTAVDALAVGISHVAALIAPQAVVLGGGLSEAGDALFSPLERRLEERCRLRRTPVVRARLGENAGVLGVALHTRETERA